LNADAAWDKWDKEKRDAIGTQLGMQSRSQGYRKGRNIGWSIQRAYSPYELSNFVSSAYRKT
jgi:hypothetical protein